MQFILNRFNEKYPKQNTLNVRFFNEDPFSTRRIRYNQSGAVCYCMENQENGKQKVSNVWKSINCNENCSHRKSIDGIAKPACKLEGTLKFLLPEISPDRIWNMKITGYTSIQRIKAYINLQKQLGNSLIGDYTLFLKKEEQTTKQGKTFNNYILDIVKTEEFVSTNSNSHLNQAPNNNSTANSNVSTSTTTEKSITTSKTETSKSIEQSTIPEKKTSKKAQKEKKTENTKEPVKSEENKKNTKNEFDNHYILLETSTQNLMKNGQPTEYVTAEFVNGEDKTISVIIPPKFAEELLQCDMGTEVILELSTAGEKTFTNSIEYVQKCLKNVAA